MKLLLLLLFLTMPYSFSQTAGEIRYNANKMEYFDGTNWVAMGSSSEGLSRVQLGSATTSNSTASAVTASFTPADGSLLIVVVGGVTESGAPSVSVSGGGLTWTQRLNNSNESNTFSGWYSFSEIWSAPVTTGASMTVTASTGQTNDGINLTVYQYLGHDASPFGTTATGIRDNAQGAYSITLAAAPAIDSEVMAVVSVNNWDGSQTDNITEGAGWTEIGIYDSFTDEAQTNIQTRTISISTSVDWVQVDALESSGASAAAIALEIKADAGTSCAGSSGEIRYNTTPDPNRLEYCDGSNWKSIEGTVTATACTKAGEITYNTGDKMILYCNGSFLVETEAPGFLVCPTGYVSVGADGVYTGADFCVMQYEAKAETNAGGSYDADGLSVALGSYKPASVSTNLPWRSITRDNARTECQSLGAGYDLISNAQWMTIARELEMIGDNWSSGTVGTGCMYQGNNGEVTACGYDGADPLASSAPGSVGEFTLSSGAKIYDFGGNLWEWTRESNSTNYGSDDYWTNITTSTHTTTGTLSDGIARSAKDQFGPAGTGYSTANANSGLGYGYLNYTSGSVIRSGDWSSSLSSAGAFGISLGVGPTQTETYLGFRCVYTPAITGADLYSSDVVLLIQPNAADTTIDDYSASGHTITAQNGTALSTAISDPWGGSRKTVLFDGINDYLEIADSSDWHYGTDDFTIESWIYYSSINDSVITPIYAQGNTPPLVALALVNNTDEGLQFYDSTTGDELDEGAERTSPTGAWSHWVVERSGNDFALYVDGASIATGTSANAVTNLAKSLYFGGGTGFTSINGYMTGVRITKGVARYTSSFTPPTEPFPAIVQPQAHWKFDETSGSNTFDSINNRNGSTLNMNFGTNSVTGQFGEAITFNGSTQSCNMPSAGDVGNSWPMTVSLWFYSNLLNQNYRKVIHKHGSQVAYQFQSSPAGTFYWSIYETGGTEHTMHTNSTIGIGTWHHAVMTIDASGNAKHYLDGVLQTETASPPSMGNGDSDMVVGKSYWACCDFNGSVDDLRLYDTVLSPAQITDLYQGREAGEK